MQKTFIYSICALCLLACSSKPELVTVEAPSLRASSIYKSDSVYNFIQTYLDKNLEFAKSYFDKGLALKDEAPLKAIYFIKRAITLCPKQEYYLELGKLLTKAGNFKEAVEMYRLLNYKRYIANKHDYIFGEPSEDILYEYIVSEIKADNSPYLDISYYITELGYSNHKIKDRLFSDRRLQLDTSTWFGSTLAIQFLEEDEIEQLKKTPAFFTRFLKTIKDSSDNFEIDEKRVANFKYSVVNENIYEESNLYDFFLLENQTEKKWNLSFEYKRRVAMNDKITAVLYAIDTSEAGALKEMRHIYYRLATYSPNGQIIDSEIIAYQSGESLATVKFDKPGFTVTNFKRVWKKAYIKTDVDNSLLKTEPTGEKKSYTITPTGEIEEVTPSAVENAPAAEGTI